MYGPPDRDLPPTEPLPGETVTEIREGPGRPPPRQPWWRNNIWFWLALVGLVAVLIVLIAIVAAQDDDEPRAAPTVPSVVGLRQARAVARLERVGYEADTERIPSGERRGIVIDQDPEGGAVLARGSTVMLTVSSGPEVVTTVETVTETVETVTVPDVVGEDHVPAGATVDGRDLIADSFPVESTQPRGIVISQEPAGGTEVPPETHVRLEVSLGLGEREDATVPDVTGPNEVEARATVREAGFTVLTIDRPAPSPEERGEVLLQRPAAGTTRPVLTQVRIFVGR